MFSDDFLMDRLVLKGGNALDLVHHLAARASLDIDFSVEGDFENVADVERRVFRALRDRFDSVGMRVFDETFRRKPTRLRPGQDQRWGGYLIEFKVIPKDRVGRFRDDLEALRRNADVIGPAQERVFKIEISKYEYCAPKVRTELDDYTIFVYPPAMIAVEKLRAICQQMPEYDLVSTKRARARDFLDIHTIVTRASVDLASTECQGLLGAVFAAKGVPLRLLGEVSKHREFHRPDWKAVVDALTEPARDFDFYFDFVVDEIERLKTAWDV